MADRNRRPSRPTALAILLLTAGSAPALASPLAPARTAAGHAPQVTPVSDTARTAEPGRATTVVFPLHNPSRAPLRQTLTLELPDGWKLLSGGGAVELAPGERRMHLAQVAVPVAAPAGIYVLIFRRDGPDRRTGGADTLRVRVVARRKLEARLVESPEFGRAGASYKSQFVMRNAGNAPLPVRIAVRASAGALATPSWSAATLAIGESRPLDVAVAAPSEIAAPLRHHLQVDATVSDDAEIAAIASSSVLVLPIRGVQVSRFHKLGATARITSSSTPVPGGRGTSSTAEISGGGLLQAGGRLRVDFLFRRPSGSVNIFGDQEEYRAALSSSRLDVSAGDQSFSLSPLTIEQRAATGVQALMKAGGFGIGGFTYRDRRSYTPASAHAGIVQYQAGRRGFVRGHYLEKQGADSGRMASVQARFSALRLATLDAEAASMLGVDSAARAFSVRMVGIHSRFSYAVTAREADAQFRGHGAGGSSRTAHADVRLVGKVGVRGGAGSHQVALDSSRAVARGALDHRFAEATVYAGGALSADYVIAERRSAGDMATIDNVETLIRVNGAVPLGPVRLRAMAERGLTSVAGDTARRQSHRTNLQATVAGGARQSYSIFAEHSDGSRWYSPVAREQVTAGIQAALKLSGALSLRVWAAGTHEVAPVPRTFGSIDASVAVAPRRGHELSLQIRTVRQTTLGRLESAVRIGYGVTLGVPVGYARNGGRFLGRVFDAETGRGLRNATVLVGDRMAVTDDEGWVEINGVGEGTQHVQLDLGAAGVNHVLAQSDPVSVVSRNGATQRVDVVVTRSVRITGSVRRLGTPSLPTWDGSRTALTDTVQAHGIAVRLTKGDEVLTRLTDADGTFTATDLRPGRWTVAVSPADLPAHHYLDTPSVILDIAPGGNATASFDVLPRKRTVVMIDAAEIVADGARASATRPSTPQPILPAPATRAPAAPAARTAAPVRTAPADQAPIPTRALPPPAQPTPPVQPEARTEAAVAAAPRALPPTRRPGFHVVSATDRNLENVAIWIYGDVGLWPKLWLANKATLTSPNALKPGMILIVPPRAPLTTAEIRAREALRKSGSRSSIPPAER